jgi:hypothetical protein
LETETTIESKARGESGGGGHFESLYPLGGIKIGENIFTAGAVVSVIFYHLVFLETRKTK